jgi:phosphohistidine phosphatase SixA
MHSDSAAHRTRAKDSHPAIHVSSAQRFKVRMNRRWCVFLALSLAWIAPNVAYSQDVIFLVRHADRASNEPDSVLSRGGEERAQCLAHVLKEASIKAIFTSEFKRTQQTAAPVALEFHIEPKIIPRANTAELVKELRASKIFPILVVAHSETLPLIVQQLDAGIIAQPGALEYDKLFIVPIRKGKALPAVALHYCAQTSDAAPVDRMH